ncbi:protein kinase [Sorangium sp. So ce375]|uniref:serine/threonine-protein kinase n=1 Tax=Sorangium sp. So ce375 TaxID=3133306 RepID=UPI003F5C630C
MTQLARPGDLLAGKYRVEKVLGEGGMGVVLAARHLRLDELVAIKLMRLKMAQDAGLVERFLREARAASKIKSEHVVRISDADTLESGAPYIVMEHLSGQDLASKLRDEGKLGIAETVGFVLEACDVLAEAHALGIIHRDLKPANLFLAATRDGGTRLKVLDFGISKLVSAGDTQDMTRTATMLGSPLYMSPEQMLSTRNVDARTDIWSLGIVLYQLLAGEAPFRAETIPQVCALVLQTDPRPLREFRPDVPAGLEAVVDRCLQKDRERRFPAVADLASALAPFGPYGSRLLADRISRLPRIGPDARTSLGSGADHRAPDPALPSSGTVALTPAPRPSEEWAGTTVAATPPPPESPPQATRAASVPVVHAAAPPPAPEMPTAGAPNDTSTGRPAVGSGVSTTVPLEAGAAPKKSGAPGALAVFAAVAAVLGLGAMAGFRLLRNDSPTGEGVTLMASPPEPAALSGQPSSEVPPPSAQPSMAGAVPTHDHRAGQPEPMSTNSATPATLTSALPATNLPVDSTGAPPPPTAQPPVAPRAAQVEPTPASPPTRPVRAPSPNDPFRKRPD